MRELLAIAAADLKRERMFDRVEIEMMRNVTMHESRRRDHFGVQPGAPRDEPEKIPAVPVGPVHHRRDTETPVVKTFSHLDASNGRNRIFAHAPLRTRDSLNRSCLMET